MFLAYRSKNEGSESCIIFNCELLRDLRYARRVDGPWLIYIYDVQHEDNFVDWTMTRMVCTIKKGQRGRNDLPGRAPTVKVATDPVQRRVAEVRY